jgi:hypothetical protein
LRSFSSEVGVIIRVQQEDFDSVELQRQLAAGRNDIGAIATFIGLVRDLEGDPLQQMTLEHYPGMTEKALEGIARASPCGPASVGRSLIWPLFTELARSNRPIKSCWSWWRALIGAMLSPPANSLWIILKPRRLSGRKRPAAKAKSGSKPGKVTDLLKKNGIIERSRQFFNDPAIKYLKYEMLGYKLRA